MEWIIMYHGRSNIATRPYNIFFHVCLSIVSEIDTENCFNEIPSVDVNSEVYDQTTWL